MKTALAPLSSLFPKTFRAVEGKEATPRTSTADRWMAPRYNVFDAKQGHWQKRKRTWELEGIEGEKGRGGRGSQPVALSKNKNLPETSVFDPALAETIYYWFCPLVGRSTRPGPPFL